jgi:hypothetical protein
VDHVVVNVPGDREMLLHLVELVVVDHGDRIFLTVHDFLRQRQIKLREGDRLHDCAQRLQGSLDLQFGRRAKFQALEILRRIDWPQAVGDVAKSIVPIAFSASGPSQSIADPSRTPNASGRLSTMKGSMTAPNAVSYLSSW